MPPVHTAVDSNITGVFAKQSID